jgi:hypothetical protein
VPLAGAVIETVGAAPPTGLGDLVPLELATPTHPALINATAKTPTNKSTDVALISPVALVVRKFLISPSNPLQPRRGHTKSHEDTFARMVKIKEGR